MKGTFTLIAFFLLFCFGSIQAQLLYSADFSNEGDGFPDHTSSSMPAAGPASSTGGTAPNDWTVSYTATPSTDGSANEFSVNSNVMRVQDWGGTGQWQSMSINIASTSVISISAMGVTIGDDVQNAASEFFEYYYFLDGDESAEVTTNVPLSDESAGTPVNYNAININVASANTINIGFRFDVNGVGDGYEISSFSVTQITALPVTLSTFTAKKEGTTTLLSWQTATELNNDYMEVQRSADGRHFTTIGKVPGKGTTQDAQDYQFTDRNPLSGLNYYRLKQVDFDGQFEYHEVVIIDFDKETEQGITLYPTASNNLLTVLLHEENGENSTFNIIGTDGRIWQTRVVEEKSRQFELSVLDLPAGSYWLQLIDGTKVTQAYFQKI